jgi:predicted nucleic acid-binding protein
MHGDFPVVLDACVLANGRLCDLYLRLAEPPRLYSPVWSEEILCEVHRVQTQKLKRPYPPELADYWREEVTKTFPEACVQDWEKLLPLAGNNEKDRHVVAAAIQAKASVIVTFNLRDFPSEALAPHGIEALHPQDHLLTLWSINAGVVISKLALMTDEKGEDLEDLLIQLGRSVPRFASAVLESLGPGKHEA